jgi:hypothetical protein
MLMLLGKPSWLTTDCAPISGDPDAGWSKAAKPDY